MGILNYLRSRATPWLGATLSRRRPSGEELTREKVTAALRTGMSSVTFLPWVNDHGSETETMRRAYRRMLADPIVKAALLSKVFGTASLSLRVQPDGNGPLAKKVATFTKWSLERSDTGIAGIVTDILLGGLIEKASVCEKVFRYIDRGEYNGHVGLARLSPLDPDTFTVTTDEFRRITGVKQTIGSSGKGGAPETYPADCFTIWQHLPLYQAGTSDLRAAYRPWYLLDTVWKLRGIFLDKIAMPVVKGTYTDETQEPALATKLAKMRALSWIAVPDDIQVEALELSQRSGQEWQQAIMDLRQEVVIGIQLGFQHILEGSQTGARASAQVHVQQSELAVWYTSEAVGNVLTKQVVPDITDLNFAGAGYPLVTLEGIDDDDLTASLAIDNGLHAMGVDLDTEELYERYGRTRPTKPENVLKGMAAAPAGGGFGGGFGGFADKVSPDKLADGATTTTTTGPAVPARRPFGQGSPAAGGERDTALAGADGKKAEALLATAQREGTAVLYEVAKSAVKRLVAMGETKAASATELFNDEEKQKLADALAATNATADLLGRSRIRLRLAKAQTGVRQFAEDATDFESFADGPPLLKPDAAVDYFKRLVPTLGVDPKRFGPAMERQAFTLAGQTDEVLLSRVQDVITQRLETGKGWSTAPQAIDDLLDEAGVGRRNAQRSEMIWRTNAQDSFQTGAMKEMQSDEVKEFMPVWKWLGILDGRQRPAHQVHFDKYYPNELSFAEVRDSVKGDFDGYNCRCSFAPIDKYEWAELQANGAKLG